jgi:hypothetical protein
MARQALCRLASISGWNRKCQIPHTNESRAIHSHEIRCNPCPVYLRQLEDDVLRDVGLESCVA